MGEGFSSLLRTAGDLWGGVKLSEVWEGKGQGDSIWGFFNKAREG